MRELIGATSNILGHSVECWGGTSHEMKGASGSSLVSEYATLWYNN